jgi:hypothetical protein
METNENICNDTTEDVIVLGVASIETKGAGSFGEVIGGPDTLGISED